MKSFAIVISLLTASALSTSALAQTGGLPPVQTPAGDPGKLERPKLTKQQTKSDTVQDSATPAAAPADKPATDKRSARKAKRAEKVGDKPLD